MILIPLQIDITKPYREPISINQFDKDEPVFLITLRSGGLPIDLTGTLVTFYAEKPDGHVLFNACTVTDAVNGKCTYKVTTQTSAAAGKLKAQIVITWGSGAEKRSEEFDVTVKPSLDITSAVESADEFTQLQEAIATIAGLTHTDSIEQDENGVHLVNDEATPGDGKYYGQENGAKGFFMPRGINPNLIINGNFDIWQRGTSQTMNAYASVDRFNFSSSGAMHSVSRQSFTVGQTDVPNNPTYYLRNVITSGSTASHLSIMRQHVENVGTLSGETVTISFWAKANASKYISIELIQNFGSGGSTSIDSIGVTKIALTTSWKKFTITTNIPSISGKTVGTGSYLGLWFWLDAGSDYNSRTNTLGHQSGTFDIAQVKLEKGSIATPFVPKTFAEELRDCQRYYEIGDNVLYLVGSGTTLGYLKVDFKVNKRTSSPTVTRTGDGTITSGTVGTTVHAVLEDGFYFKNSGVAIGGVWTADAEL